ncbi:minor capsid protein [Latilactobacillus phage TMW 1.1393 P1]|uniref:phage portal protein n=1 Tax=Latilactobacillus sakei TaxID=1599 RepID=UPI0027A9A6E8|nr:minor capsid protein [Latilactobacillus phage TMW 1.1393 P1]
MFDRIKNLFRKAGAEIGMVNSLTKIVDHPKINVEQSEYDRIAKSLQYFEGGFDDVKYHNSDHELKTRPYMSINMMKVVAKRMASLLYNEQCRINVGGDNEFENANEFIQATFSDNDFNKNFERYLESDLALGGLVIRPYFDVGQGKIKLSWCQAPTIYPLQNNTNDVSEIAIASVNQTIENGKVVYYTLLEFHEWVDGVYQITNELYRSENKSVVGIQVPLSSYEAYKDIEPVAKLTKVTRPVFTYLKPQGFNNRNITSPLGIGVCDNALSTLKHINDTFDQFNWEIKMGQRRVAVPEDLTSLAIDERGKSQPKQVFDPNQNVFVKMRGDSEEGFKITDMTSEIRSQAYIEALNNALQVLEMQVGLTAGTFSFDAKGGLKTATEVVSENSMTQQTRSSQLTTVDRAIKELIISILELAKSFDAYTGEIPTMGDISIDFDDGVVTDKQQQLDFFTQAKSAGFVSTKLAVKKIFGYTDDQADDLIKEINEEAPNEPAVENIPSFEDGDE